MDGAWPKGKKVGLGGDRPKGKKVNLDGAWLKGKASQEGPAKEARQG